MLVGGSVRPKPGIGTETFFNFLFKNSNFSHVFPLLGDISFYKLENKPRESENIQYFVVNLVLGTVSY